MSKYKLKRLLSVLIILLVIVACISEPQDSGPNTPMEPSVYGLPENIEDGVMLHAYRWRFKDIQENLKKIAETGYKSIQVSPVQGTKSSGSQWWLMYQPVNLHIGNTQLGSYDDFKALCEDAENNYGIKIIVDAVLNQVADNGNDGQWDDNLDPDLKKSFYFHNKGTVGDYKNREKVTQQNLGNGPDWNTQRSDVQQMHLAFLNECIDAGADGFRFDAAKHIETNKDEDAGKSWAGNYWDVVLGGLHNKNNLYLFGEVLPDDGDNDQAYLSYFDITAHSYGGTLRNAVYSKNVNGILNVNHHNHDIAKDKALAYVENHDNYEHKETSDMGFWERKMAHAMIVARAGMTPRLFDRPTDDMWKDDDIIAVNKFRNAMVGQPEYLRIPRNETLIIERGNSGMVIVNLGGDTYIDSPTNIKNGSYSNKATAQVSLDVANGKIKGNIPGGKIIVLYEGVYEPVGEVVEWTPEKPEAGESVTITYNASTRNLKGSSSMKIHQGFDGWKDPKQTSMSSLENDKWQVTLTVPSDAKEKIDFVFTNGEDWDNNDKKDWSIAVEGGGSGDKLIVHFLEYESATTYTIHCWDGLSGDFTMEYEGSFNNGHWWKVALDNAPDNFKFCFTNSNGKWDGGNRIYSSQANEIYVKAWDNNIYTSRP
ncbi:MAG: carbohydrate-binding protein [bacterium]